MMFNHDSCSEDKALVAVNSLSMYMYHSPGAQVLQALMPVLFGQLYSLKNMQSSGCPWASPHTA